MSKKILGVLWHRGFFYRHSPKVDYVHMILGGIEALLKGCLILKGSVLHYFAEGNTARGYANLYETNVFDLQKLLIIKGGSKSLKSSLMSKIGVHYQNQGYSLHYIHCPMDHRLIDGIIIEELAVGVVDGYGIQMVESRLASKVKRYLNIDYMYTLNNEKARLEQLTLQMMKLKQEAYRWYEKALYVHDEWEAIFIDNMDFEKANELTEELLARLFIHTSAVGKGRVYRRFLGAATPIGAVDYVPALTEGLSRRFFIKGRPGSGKSTMLKKIAIEAEMKGYDVEVYHCGLDPHSLDMVIVRELNFAIFDSTAPHEYFPAKEGDEIIDVYARCIVPSTDEDYAGDIAHIVQRYKEKMKNGTAALAEAKKFHEELEQLYEARLDLTKVEDAEKRIESFIEDVRSSLKA